MNKKLLLSFALTLGLCGCNGTTTPSNSTNGGTNYNDVTSHANFDESNELNFVQTMENKLDDNLFYSLEGAWHTDVAGGEHNGMKHHNLFYTNDGEKSYLAIKGRGYYNKESDTISGKPEGGCIVSKNHLGPGRYEIDMAAMPREGGVTAMWTYCTTTGSEATSQNEIDIEIGGTTNGTNFKSLWATSWTKKTTKETNTIDVTENLYLNDGKIHKYTFDWYTNYNNEDIKRVDWFIDGIYINSIEGNVVPEHEMPLWIGLWFPPLWAGQAAFDSDYMLVEKISYKAFDENQYYETCRSETGYNKLDPSKADIKNLDFNVIKNLNKLSNPDFESLDIAIKDDSYYGWKVDEASLGSLKLCEGKTNNGFELIASDNSTETFHGEYLKQTITNTFEGFKYNFKIDAKLKDANSEGNVEIYIKNSLGKTIEKHILKVESLTYQTLQKELILPKDSYQIEIDITAENGSVCYDNASLIYII